MRLANRFDHGQVISRSADLRAAATAGLAVLLARRVQWRPIYCPEPLSRPPTPPLAGNINSNGTGQFAGQPRFKVGSWPRRAAILPVLWHVPAERHSELCLVLPCADLLNPVCASFCCCRPAPRWWSSSKRRTCSAARWTTPCAWASARGEFGQSAGLHQHITCNALLFPCTRAAAVMCTVRRLQHVYFVCLTPLSPAAPRT